MGRFKWVALVLSIATAFVVGAASGAWHKEEWSPTMWGEWEAVANESGLTPGHIYTADFQVFYGEYANQWTYHRGVSGKAVDKSGRIQFRVPSGDLFWSAPDGGEQFTKIRAVISECVPSPYGGCVADRDNKGYVPAIHPVNGKRMVSEFYFYPEQGY